MHTNKIKQFILLLGDIAALFVSLYLTLLIRYQEKPDSELMESHLLPFTGIFLIWIFALYIFNLYNLNRAAANAKFFQSVAKADIFAGLLSAAFFYLNPLISIAPKRNLIIYILVFSLIFFIWRNLYNLLIGSYLPKNKIGIIGSGKEVEELKQEINSKPQLGYKVALEINDENQIDELKKIAADKNIKLLVLASDLNQSEKLRSALFALIPLKINFVSFTNFYENITGKIPVEIIGKTWFLENLNEGDKFWFDFSKRIFDFTLAAAIFLITILFWLPVALIIKLESKGPVFIKMIRSGRNKRAFKMYKFRTMKEEGNTRAITVKNDPRITRFGSFMRKTRIDEIPQVINILKGEMSFVGPRPERPELIVELEQKIPFYNERMLVKPGVTGSDQISGEYHSPTYEDTLKKLQYDLYYIKNRSLYLDLSIILKTIATVLGREGR